MVKCAHSTTRTVLSLSQLINTGKLYESKYVQQLINLHWKIGTVAYIDFHKRAGHNCRKILVSGNAEIRLD